MELCIARRFRGPPDSGNGGYTAGLIAATLDAPGGPGCHADAADSQIWSIKLRSPPPLETALQLMPGDGGVFEMRAPSAAPASKPIAVAVRADFPLAAVPSAVAPDVARHATARHRHWNQDRFATCFVCGSARAAGDGLRVFTGPIADAPLDPDGRVVATLWQPDAALAEDGFIATRYLWSALDCPGYFAIAMPGDYLLLAQMSARIHARPRPQDALIVQAWPLGRQGRSLFAGTALFAQDGRLLAAGHTRWVAPVV